MDEMHLFTRPGGTGNPDRRNIMSTKYNRFAVEYVYDGGRDQQITVRGYETPAVTPIANGYHAIHCETHSTRVEKTPENCQRLKAIAAAANAASPITADQFLEIVAANA